MNKTAQTLLIVVGAGIGFWVGVVLGFLIPFLACGLIDTITGSQLGQVGWIALFATLPGGAFIGFVLGGVCIANRPRLFLLTFFPLFIIFVAYQITFSKLRKDDRPRTYVLQVSGWKGGKFVGLVRADGELHKVEGIFPAEFEYEALHVDFAFALLEPKGGDKISIKVLVDGKPSWGIMDRVAESEEERKVSKRSKDYDIIAATYKSFGYAEWAGGTSYEGGNDLREEVARLRE